MRPERERPGRRIRGSEGESPMEAPAPIEGVLDDAERESVELRFGVSTEQVVRDHVISHALAAIATVDTDDLVFFGGR